MLLPLRTLFDPAPKQFDLLGGQLPLGVERRHALVGVVACDPTNCLARRQFVGRECDNSIVVQNYGIDGLIDRLRRKAAAKPAK
jgi:hypothetical protein